ncbi:MAG: cob(I)yrinic acid a,c-diamide adenosyltransferase [Anaerolineae bacterium]|nr:cob(I)yrinic acid a,c-diamide adenosyltransferase [Anaerolineae bacterium]
MTDSEFYTGRGDDGYTGLLGPERVPKYDPRPEAYGTVDEAQAAMGLARAAGCAETTDKVLLAIQRDLYQLMAELASAGFAGSPFRGAISAEHVGQLEAWIARFEEGLEMPREFVVPGDSQPGAALHLARTVVRRAERLAVRLLEDGLLANRQVLRYLNRLSSLLFVLAVVEDQATRRAGLTLAREEEQG